MPELPEVETTVRAISKFQNKILKEKEAEAAKILEQSAPKEEVIEEKKPEKKKSCSCC